MNCCIVVPCYNEGKRIDVNAFIIFLTNNNNISFCFINDGSRDNTISILQNIKSAYPNRIIIIDSIVNQGKAEAIRSATNVVNKMENFDYIGFIDADLAAPLFEINHLIYEGVPNHKIIIGCRFKRMGSKIYRSALRHYIGRIFATFASLILKLPVYDTQCGLKLFEREISENIFQDPFISKWIFDVELLARIIGNYGKSFAMEFVLEVPLMQWEDKKGSKIKLGFFFRAPFDLLRIYFKYKKMLKNI